MKLLKKLRLPVRGTIVGVERIEVDGRPQLILKVRPLTGGAVLNVPMDRDMARALTKAYGHSKIVDEFFADGEGLQ